jgi:hypothetical protein
MFMTDTYCNHNGGNAMLTIERNGTLNVDRLSFSNDPASTTSLVRIHTGGTLIVRDRLIDRDGVSALQIDGGTVNLQNENAAAIYREVDDLILGGSDAGSNLAMPVGSVPLNLLVGTGSSVQASGTHNIEATSVASGIADAEISTTWIGGTDTWVNADSTKWSGYAAPDGGVPIGANIPVIKSAATIAGASAATWAVTGAEAAKSSGAGAMTDLVADDTIALTVGTSFDIGALRAVIDDPASVVTRTGDLRVARDESADAQQLDVNGGSFTLTGGELIIGGVQDNDAGPTFVGGVVDDTSNVTVGGGTMTVPSVRFFGSTALPLADTNDVPMGGILNVNGGTLTVTGDIIEGPGAGDTSVQQSRIDVDGGVLDLASPTATVTVQHFRVANDGDTTGSFTRKDGQTLNVVGGSFQVANNGGGRRHLHRRGGQHHQYRGRRDPGPQWRRLHHPHRHRHQHRGKLPRPL